MYYQYPNKGNLSLSCRGRVVYFNGQTIDMFIATSKYHKNSNTTFILPVTTASQESLDGIQPSKLARDAVVTSKEYFVTYRLLL